MKKLTLDDAKEKGYCVPIFRAVELAGGPDAVRENLGLKSAEAVKFYYRNWTVPSRHLIKLCEMGGNKVKPTHILAAMEEKRAA